MNRIKSTLMLIVLFGLVMSNTAWADRGHSDRGHSHIHRRAHIGVFVGPPLAWPWYYPPPYYAPYNSPYYYPPVVTVPSMPPVYIEQGEAETTPAPQSYWYYCDQPPGYYPYVKECPGGWQAVAPQPPSQP